jgi:signal transduction histidine kinase
MIVTSWALEDAAGQLPPGALAEVRRRLEGAIEACRAIESDLRPPKLVDAGVSDAVEELAARRRADSPFTIEVIDELDGARFALHTELLIFRSVQEALRLLRQQSGATTVTITLRSEGGTLTALVADDGAGARTGDDPVPPEAASGPYAGAAMRDPVLLAGGRYQTGPGPEGGRELRIEVPATSRDHDR